MSPILSTIVTRIPLADAIGRHGIARVAPVVAIHLAALAVMLWSEDGVYQTAAFLLSWGILNFFWLALLRRPGLSALLSFILIAILIVVSRFKFDVLWMTASFVDVMIIDADTFAFLWSIFPQVRTAAIITIALAIAIGIVIWRLDPFRVRRRMGILGAAGCLAALTGLALWEPLSPGAAFGDGNYVSTFARSGVDAVGGLMTEGLMESDKVVVDRLRLVTDTSCQPARKLPHIILVHDESSFDIRAIGGVKVPPNYGHHFLSFDGKQRNFLTEGAGGPSWYTEYNVLSGLSSRSFGRFQFFVTRIAAGRVERGLPRALQRCGYRTFAVYPAHGGFLGAGSYYKGVGVEHFIDGKAIGGRVFEPDRFYFDIALRMIERERARAPMFLFVYLTANHFTWDYPFREDLTPEGWKNPGNTMLEIDEFLRRQVMTERDYSSFLASLKRDFPGEEFLIVRYGDHQPDFAKLIIEPDIDGDELGRRLYAQDPRYYMTYYAIDAVNFRPVTMDSALGTLDAPYLPLVVLEAAGVPLDASFAEQKKILARCNGLFYGCAGGAEARRFNRLLIDAGLIKGL